MDAIRTADQQPATGSQPARQAGGKASLRRFGGRRPAPAGPARAAGARSPGQADDAFRAECAAAEAFACGAAGLEEGATPLVFSVYVPGPALEAVRAALRGSGVTVLSASPEPDRDWSEAWKEDLAPIRISSRLLVRPSSETVAPEPGQQVLVIDPAQAFGTGAHESTRLALEGVDAWAGEFHREDRLLDVGTGTGVLALAALALGCGRAVGFDLDPLAGPAVRENAARNGLARRLDAFVGGIEALPREARFRFVAANLLLSEVEPVLAAIGHHCAPGGHVLFSGLLEAQAARVEARAKAVGLVLQRTLVRDDASGARWVALLMRREPFATNP